jgi:hypothetical protein
MVPSQRRHQRPLLVRRGGIFTGTGSEMETLELTDYEIVFKMGQAGNGEKP